MAALDVKMTAFDAKMAALDMKMVSLAVTVVSLAGTVASLAGTMASMLEEVAWSDLLQEVMRMSHTSPAHQSQLKGGDRPEAHLLSQYYHRACHRAAARCIPEHHS